MGRLEQTYYLARLLEERFGPVVPNGAAVTYRGKSRIPWLDANLEIDNGCRFVVQSVAYDPALSQPDYEEWDGHYYYDLGQEQGTVTSMELLAFFDCAEARANFARVCRKVKNLVKGNEGFESFCALLNCRLK
ncbi:MAG: hypothetical protein NT049_15340 [Planctomycetota bacterium]|nr:hypothetical protein [Planctomycetota bacterium]